MKKLITKLLFTTVALVAMTGCGGGGGGDEEVTIEFKHRNGQASTEIIDSIIQDFQKENPKIHVVNTKFNGNYDQLRDQIVSDLKTEEFPDIAECYPDHVERYFAFGKVAKLNDLINDPNCGLENQEDIVSAFLEEGQRYSMKGLYSLPLSKSEDAMFYNTKILGKVIPGVYEGKPIDKSYIDNLTWDEIFDNLGPGVKLYNQQHPGNELYDETVEHSCVFGWDSDQNLFVTLAEQYQYGYTAVDQTTGKGSLLWNNENMRGLMSKLRTAKDAGYFQTSGSHGDYVNTLFTKQGCLFSVGSTGGYSYQCDGADFEVGVARIPQAPAGTPNRKIATINQGPSVCFLKHANQTDARLKAAMKFYNYFINTVNNATWSTSTGYMPVRGSVATTNKFINYVDETRFQPISKDHCAAITMKHALTTLQGGELFSNVTFTGSSECRSICGSLVTSILTAEKAPTADEIKSMFDKAENDVKAAME